MWFLSLLLACATQAASSPAPGDWFYADRGDAIDWSSIRFDGADVVFRTIGEGLESGPVQGAALLACGTATRATLAFAEGVLVDVVTVPALPCVEAAAQAIDWAELQLDGEPLGERVHALVVYDVPAEASCSSCS
ncbi:MAG: hypothetical protein Q8P41_01130 [Pseudomonadota bacterium]|nr:hypothetical protein [Pseudomonadota bacterium]